MNPSVWRLLLTCLLLITLPLKGWAAVGMAACGTSHHRADGSTALLTQVVATSVHADLHDHHASDRHDADAVQATGGDLVKCSGCAPCSMGAALTGAVIVRIPALPATAELPAIESHYLSVDVVGFERPPRTVRA